MRSIKLMGMCFLLRLGSVFANEPTTSDITQCEVLLDGQKLYDYTLAVTQSNSIVSGSDLSVERPDKDGWVRIFVQPDVKYDLYIRIKGQTFELQSYTFKANSKVTLFVTKQKELILSRELELEMRSITNKCAKYIENVDVNQNQVNPVSGPSLQKPIKMSLFVGGKRRALLGAAVTEISEGVTQVNGVQPGEMVFNVQVGKAYRISLMAEDMLYSIKQLVIPDVESIEIYCDDKHDVNTGFKHTSDTGPAKPGPVETPTDNAQPPAPEP